MFRPVLLYTGVFISLLYVLPAFAAEEDKIIDTIREYNKRLIKVYTTLDLALLEGVATTDEINRVFPVVQALLNKNSIMVAHQKTFKVKKFKMINANRASVETEELWFYWWQEKKTGSITRAPHEFLYKVRYHMIKDSSGWKVDKLEEVR